MAQPDINTDARIADLEAQLAEMTRERDRFEAKKSSLQDDVIPGLIYRAETAEAQLAARTEGVVPEILTALKWFIDDIDGTRTDMTDFDANVERSRVAIAKAEGTISPAAPEEQHPDDSAVDSFATAMKANLAKKRAEGRGGWQDPENCSTEYLSKLLRDHVKKGDPLDVGNLAMMLHQREAPISPAPEAQQEPVAWRSRNMLSTHGWNYTDTKPETAEQYYDEPLYTRPAEQAVTEAFEEVAQWHEKNARYCREASEDDPRMNADDRKRAREAGKHHAASAASIRNKLIVEKRNALKAAMEAQK